MKWTRRVERVMLAVLLLAVLAPGWVAAQADGGTVNPHWSKTGCPQCHIDAAPGSPNATLKPEGAEAVCAGCHGDDGEARHLRVPRLFHFIVSVLATFRSHVVS